MPMFRCEGVWRGEDHRPASLLVEAGDDLAAAAACRRAGFMVERVHCVDPPWSAPAAPERPQEGQPNGAAQ